MRVIPNDSNLARVLCGAEKEHVDHHFCTCPFSQVLWYNLELMGCSWVLDRSVFGWLLGSLSGAAFRGRGKLVWWTIPSFVW